MSNKDIEHYIYGLYYYDEGTTDKTYFYIGRTDDYENRMKQHSNCVSLVYKKNCPGGARGDVKIGQYGEEAKAPRYAFIRKYLTPVNIGWHSEVVERVIIGSDAQITEDMVIVRMLRARHPLQNSKDGDGPQYARLERIANSDYKDINLDLMKNFDKLEQQRIVSNRQQDVCEEEERLLELDRLRTIELAQQDRVVDQVFEAKQWFEVLSSSGWVKGSKNIAVHKRTQSLIEVNRDIVDNNHRVYTTPSVFTELRVGYGDTIKEAYRALALEMTKDPIDNFELQQK